MVTFTPNGSGGYTAPTQVLATLVPNGDGSWTYTRRARQIFTFNAAGQLSTVRDLNGETVTVAHTTGGQISTVTDGAGRALAFAYNPAHIRRYCLIDGKDTYRILKAYGCLRS